MAIEIRRLRPGDEAVVARLADHAPRIELLGDERVFFLVAFDDGEPVGFVLAHELLRRHAPPSELYVHEVDVEQSHRRRGIARRLLAELGREARKRGIEEGFLITNASNEPAMALYAAVGGTRPAPDDVVWELRWSAAS